IMQESFFKAFEKIGTYKNEVSFGAWLKRIVVNSSLDFLKKKRLLSVPIDEVIGLQNQQEESNDDFVPESVEQLREAIQKLPDGYKLIINLVLVEGYSHDEVANMLSISASTSRSQLARAKKRLIELLNTKK
ncbi:MAG TPA: sigma-70 family RNA polymerase sigma factor, partial [Tenuifilaceae bacterium]|nr:sigma-70 family RNA polymerase sigma factor [Tenuifilaceae bacterium]